MPKESQIEIIKGEINNELATAETANALLATTFKGFSAPLMKQAIMEGMLRGFTFKDFLEKNVYAIPYGQGYSLVTSIDFARKIAMRSGLVGKSEPRFVEKDGKIESCSVTIKRAANGVIGEYTSTVYFDEYNTKRNQWVSKPHTMIAKVAEVHALRSAFPEEMAKNYVEEEMQMEMPGELIDEHWKAEVDAIKSTDELKKYYLKNKGKGKEFDKYVTLKKQQLTNENL